MNRYTPFGLDISDNSVEVVQLDRPLFGRPRIGSYGRVVLTPGVIIGGVVKNKAALAETIRQALARAKPRPIKARMCVVSLSDAQVFSTIFKFPAGLRRSEVKNTIPYTAEEVLPFKGGEVLYDFRAIEVYGPTQEVLYVAAPVASIAGYVDVLRDIGIHPVSIECAPLGVFRALRYRQKATIRPSIIIDIGSRTTNISVVDVHGVRMTNTMRVGGATWTRKIARDMDITVAAAEKLKRSMGVKAVKGKSSDRKVTTTLQAGVQTIITEAASLADFYRQEHDTPIAQVFVAGGSAYMPGVVEFIGNKMGIEASLINPLQGLGDSRVLRPKAAVVFASAIGAALRGLWRRPVEKDINLLPVEPARFRLAPPLYDIAAWHAMMVRAVVLAVLGACLVLVVYWQYISQNVSKVAYVAPQVPIEVAPETEDQATSTTATSTPVVVDPIPNESTSTVATSTEPTVRGTITVLPVSLGYVNVRTGPGVTFEKIAEAPVGTLYQFIDERAGWYQIILTPTSTGWLIGMYAEKTLP